MYFNNQLWKERLPEEFQYEFEQEMLKHIHDLKKELREKGWTQRDIKPEVHQPSFLRSDESDVQLGSSLSNEILFNHLSPQNDIIKCILWFLIDASGDVVRHIFHNRTIIVFLNISDGTPHNLCKCSNINFPILQTIGRKSMSQTIIGIIVVWLV